MNVKKLAVLASLGLFAVGSAAAETINFNNQSASNGSAFTTDTQGNFTVTNTGGQYYIGQLFGDPVPDLYVYQGGGTITVTRNNGGDFTFSSVDLASLDATNTYAILGLLNGASVFSFSGALAGTNSFAAYGTGDSADVINALTIRLRNANGESDLDNIVVNTAATPAATPEPSSLLLLGTGVLGMAGAMRRRLWA